jgi:hypothetical protein
LERERDRLRELLLGLLLRLRLRLLLDPLLRLALRSLLLRLLLRPRALSSLPPSSRRRLGLRDPSLPLPPLREGDRFPIVPPGRAPRCCSRATVPRAALLLALIN